MNALRKIRALLIFGLISIYAIGCGDVNTQLKTEDPEVVDETVATNVDETVATNEDKAPIQTDGKPITVTDATFEDVVLNAEMPVVVELRAEW